MLCWIIAELFTDDDDDETTIDIIGTYTSHETADEVFNTLLDIYPDSDYKLWTSALIGPSPDNG